MPRRLQLTLAACVVLTIAVLVNVLALQTSRLGAPVMVPAAPVAPGSQMLAETGASSGTSVAAKRPEAQQPGAPAADAALSIRDLLLASTPAPKADPALVRAVQRELAAAGYDPGAVNGKAGLMTRSAILAFEQDHGLPLTAEPTEPLLKQIVLGAGAPAAAGEDVAKVAPGAAHIIASAQRLLAYLGYLKGKATGLPDLPTAKAIRKFEAAAGLPETGRVSSALISELTRMSGARISVADEALAP